LKGHGFSRANNANRINGALAPEGRISSNVKVHRTLFRSLFSHVPSKPLRLTISIPNAISLLGRLTLRRMKTGEGIGADRKLLDLERDVQDNFSSLAETYLAEREAGDVQEGHRAS
jgi:hypothetical protein